MFHYSCIKKKIFCHNAYRYLIEAPHGNSPLRVIMTFTKVNQVQQKEVYIGQTFLLAGVQCGRCLSCLDYQVHVVTDYCWPA